MSDPPGKHSEPRFAQTVLRAVSGSTGIYIAGTGLTFLVGIQLARSLGADGYGVYGLAMSVVALLTIPTQFGLPPLVTREVAAAHAAGDALDVHAVLSWARRAVVAVAVGEALLAALVLLVLGERVEGSFQRTLLLGLGLAPLLGLGSLNGAALRGLQHIVKGQLPDVLVRPAAFSTLLAAGALSSAPSLTPALAIASHLLAAALAVAAGAVLLGRVLPAKPASSAPPTGASARWLGSAIPMALTQGARVLQEHLLVLVLGALASASVVGIFRVSIAVALSIAMPLNLLNVVAAPLLARLHAVGDIERLRKLLAWVAAGMLGGVALLSLPFLLLGDELLGLVFGAEFAPSNAPLLVACLGTALSASMGANAALLNMTGHEKRVMRAFVASLVALAVCAVPLILWLGATGAAIAQTIGTTLWNVLLWRDARVYLDLDTSFLGLLRRSHPPARN